MKVILSKDIPGLGKRGDVKDLKPGYARNLILSKKAEPATEKLLDAHHKTELKNIAEREHTTAQILETITQINGKVVTISERANEQGHLYEGIALEKITTHIKKELGVSLNSKLIAYEKPIKEKGDFPLDLVFENKVRGTFIVRVTPL